MIPGFEQYKEKWHVASDTAIKPGLQAIEGALVKLQQPQEALQVVHLAGTNGKGSTLTFIEYIASRHGLSVGKFMSPCVLDVHDQIQVNGVPISPQQMDELFKVMRDAGLSGQLTDFELLTCAALLHFKHTSVDLVLLEAGMGGREDSTNVVTPLVSVIPSIALEHTNYLGDTIESIARHKAGIIKLGKPVVIGQMEQLAQQIIQDEARSLVAPMYAIGEQFFVTATVQGDRYENKDVVIEGLHRQLPGDHQRDNMALAITAFLQVAKALEITINIDSIKAGIAAATVPGRFEQVLPNVYFDGAHNPASAEMLARTIEQQFPHQKIEFVIGMLRDKDVTSVLRIFERVSNHFTFVNFSNARAISAEQMQKLSQARELRIVEDCVELLKQSVPSGTVRIVTGSLYLLNEIRNKL